MSFQLMSENVTVILYFEKRPINCTHRVCLYCLTLTDLQNSFTARLALAADN